MKARFLWRALRARYRDERLELRAIKSVLRPGDTACDIGANKGGYLWWLNRWVGGGQVVAFEPQPKLAEYLRRAAARLKLDSVVVEEKAVAAATGTARFVIPQGSAAPGGKLAGGESTGSSSDGAVQEIETVALDDYFPAKARVAALKIDVEGAELEVFRGAQRILTERRPLLVFECEQRHLRESSVYNVFEFLHGFGYQGQCVTHRGLIDVAEFKVETHQPRVGERYWARREYANNFIFRPRAA